MKNEDIASNEPIVVAGGLTPPMTPPNSGSIGLSSQPNGRSIDDRIDALLMATERMAVHMDSLVGQQEIMRKEEQKNRELMTPVTEEQAEDIHDAVSARVYSYLGLKTRKKWLTPEQKCLRNVYAGVHFDALWSALKDRFKVAKYRKIRAADYDKALQFIADWVPDNEDELRNEAEESWKARHPGQDLNEYLGRLPV